MRACVCVVVVVVGGGGGGVREYSITFYYLRKR